MQSTKFTLIASVAVVLAWSSASAEVAPKIDPAKATEIEREGHCEQWSTYAERVMTERQNGGDAAEMIRDANRNGESAAPSKQIILAAFEAPGYVTEGAKQHEITKFKNRMYLACLKRLQAR